MPDAYDTHRPIHCHKIRPIALNAARFATMFLHVALVDSNEPEEQPDVQQVAKLNRHIKLNSVFQTIQQHY
jgi:hypothetical protein